MADYKPSLGGEIIGQGLKAGYEALGGGQSPPAQPAAPSLDLMLEAEKRGLLPPDKMAVLTEARKRGLIADTEPTKTQGTQRSAWEAAGRGALQGATANFSDEIYAGGRGIADALTPNSVSDLVTGTKHSFSDGYDRGLAEVRKANHEAEAQHPTASLGGELAGSALPLAAGYLATALSSGAAAPAAAVTTARTATLLNRMMTGAKTGAAYGAAYGVGGAESAPDATLGEAALNRVTGGLKGAAVGGAAGAALTPAIDAAGSVVNGLMNPVRAALNPKGQAASKLAEAFQRDGTPGQGPMALATQDKPHLFADAGSTLADVGGENVRGKMRSALNVPNAERDQFTQMLNERQKAQPGAVEDQLAKNLGDPAQYYATADKIVADRAAKAKPAFDAAWEGDIEPSDKLLSVFNRNEEGLYTKPTIAKISEDVGKRLADENDGVRAGIASNPGNVLHEFKVELDHQIGAAKRAADMGTASSSDRYDLRSLMKLKTQMMDGIAESGGTFPSRYLGALKQYGTDSGLKTALRDGANEVLTLQPEEIARNLAKLSDPEAQMYRLGAARTLAEKNRVGKYTNDRVSRDWQSPDRDMRMKEILPKDAQSEFNDRMQALGAQSETRRAAQGNSTTAKQLLEAQDDQKPAEMVKGLAAAATTPYKALLDHLGTKANYLAGMTPRVAEETLKMLATPLRGPGAASTATIKDIQQAIAAQELFRQRGEALIRATTRGSASLTPQQRQR